MQNKIIRRVKIHSPYSMVKIPRAETGDKRNTTMWNKRQEKTNRK
jgi:hypothetical protein